jgi:4-amino-4-deoxy-L-arabinose transferase-like glycosyltransferase
MLALCGILLLYLVLILPTVGRLGISWDEQVDLTIARSYLHNPHGFFEVTADDPSQARLPMLFTAVVFRLFGTESLLAGRLATVFVGALTLIGVYEFGRKRFSHGTGLLACAMLAISPFFLAFARVACTESDVYLACALIWLLVALDQLGKYPTRLRAAAAGICLGLTFGAKATAALILPIAWLSFLEIPPQADLDRRPLWRVNIGLCFILAGVAAGVICGQIEELDEINPGFLAAAIMGWAAALVAAFLRPNVSASRLMLGIYFTAVGFFTVLIVPPEHLLNAGIFGSLLDRGANELSLSSALSTLLFHFSVLFFKSGPIFGVITLGAFGIAIWRCKARAALRLPLAFAGTYLAGLALIPCAQPFYTIPILPILVVLAADALLALGCIGRFRTTAIGIIGILLASLAGELLACYPDFQLNGRQWVGASLFGRETEGYRCLVQTPSDGVEQAMGWLGRHAHSGDRVTTYFGDVHIRESIAGSGGYCFVPGDDVTNDGKLRKPPEYIVIHINALDGMWIPDEDGDYYRMNLDRSWLAAHYRKVFSVTRRFGIEMVSIWKRAMS